MSDSGGHKPNLDLTKLPAVGAPGATGQPFSGTGFTLNFVNAKAGTVLPAHSHPQEQISFVESGRVRFVIDGQEPFELGPHEMTYIPPNVEHSSEVLEDIVSYDVFSPVMEELMRKAAEAA